MPSYSGIWSLSQQFQGRGQGLWPQLPGAPTIGTATVVSATSASVPFTAPACAGVPATITGYTATSTPGCVTGTAASSPITVSGLTTGTAYTFKVKAQNATGFGACSAASNSVTPSVIGQQAYTTPGTYSWVAPAGVTSVSVVAVGGGSAGGGGLGYKNNYSVTPGSSYAVVVGAIGPNAQCAAGNSSFVSTAVVRGGGGSNVGGTYTGDGGGNGGASYGGGAGGYAGNGGNGVGLGTSGQAGTGGAGGSGGNNTYGCDVWVGGGGGVGILGQGANGGGGAGGSPFSAAGGGGGGSCGTNGTNTTNGGASRGNGGAYGGGRGFNYEGYGTPSGGAVRIIWPGTTRSFPSTNTGNL